MKLLVFASTLASCAPAPPAVAPVVPPTPPLAVAPAPQSSARLLGLEIPTFASARLRTPEGVVHVGDGRWWLAPPNKPEISSPYLVDGKLVDVRVDAQGLLLLANDGAASRTESVLGRVVEAHPPTKHKYSMYALGKGAMIGLDRDGSFARSLDRGVSWSTGTLTLTLRPLERVQSFAANARGEVLVQVEPQRIYLSTDDGVTFAPIDAGLVVSGVSRDVDGDLFAHGEESNAKLTAGKLAPASWTAPTFKPSVRREDERIYSAGDRFVRIAIKKGDPDEKLAVAVTSSELREPTPLDVGALGRLRVIVGGHGHEIVLAAIGSRTKLFRTVDDGATWQPLGELAGDLQAVFVTSVATFLERRCNGAVGCAPHMIRAGSTFKPLDAPPTEFMAVLEDAPHKRWFAWAPPKLLVGALGGTTLTAATVELPGAELETVTLDDQGTIRGVSYNGELFRVTTSPFAVLPTLFLPNHVRAVALAGPRGLADDGEHWLETIDGGEHWAPFPKRKPSVWELTCNTLGCGVGEVLRLGWELAPGQPAPLAASLARVPEPKAPVVDALPEVPRPLLKLTCKASKSSSTLKGWSAGTFFDGDVRTMVTDPKTRDLRVVRKAITQHTLIKPRAIDKALTSRNTTASSPEGYIAARYSFVFQKGSHNPVDVDLGWYRIRTNKVTSVMLPQVSPFRVSSGGRGALLALVDDGVLFLPHEGASPLYFIRDGGKVETLTRPPGTYFRAAVKKGPHIIVASSNYALSDDGGKTWSTVPWSAGYSSELGFLNDAPTLLLDDAQPVGTLPLKLANEAPAATPFGKNLFAFPRACDLGSRANVSINASYLVVEVNLDGKVLSANASAWLRAANGGGVCIERVAFEEDDTTITIPFADPAHSWSMRRTDDATLGIADVSCKL